MASLINTPSVEQFAALLTRLYGQTYLDQDPDSVVQRELLAWSTLLHLGRDAIDRAFRQAFPDLADELIAEWERTYQLPNDSARTIAERQRRLASMERWQKGAARPVLEGAIADVSTVAQFGGARRDEVVAAGAEDNAVFQMTLQLSNAEFFNPVVRDAVERVFTNAMPSRRHGTMSRLGRGWTTAVEVGAELASPIHYMNRDALGAQTDVIEESPAQPARVKSFGPRARIDAEDVNAAQETALMAFSDGDGTGTRVKLYTADPGTLTRWFFLTVPADGTVVLVDQSFDWRMRHISMSFHARQGVDLRPGQAEDDQWGPALASQLNWYSGPGTASPPVSDSYTARTSPLLAHWRVFVDSTFGALRIQRNGDAGADYTVCGVVAGTEPF